MQGFQSPCKPFEYRPLIYYLIWSVFCMQMHWWGAASSRVEGRSGSGSSGGGGGGEGGAHFGCMHNEIPRVIPPVCQGPVVKKASRGWRRRVRGELRGRLQGNGPQ